MTNAVDPNPAIHNDRGLLQLRGGDFEAALADFTDAIAHPARVDRPYVRRGWLEGAPRAGDRARGRDEYVAMEWDEAEELLAAAHAGLVPAGPATASVVRPAVGSARRGASFARERTQRVFPSSSRTGAESASRACRAAAASAVARMRGCRTLNGSSTLAALRSSAPSSFTIVRAAAERSRTRPTRAGRMLICSP